MITIVQQTLLTKTYYYIIRLVEVREAHMYKLIQKYSMLSLVFLFIVLTSCTYKDRVQPLILPSNAHNTVIVNGLYITAISYENADAAKKAFGFNIRKAGLLPVQISFQNEGEESVSLVPEQTFLVDSKNQAWPINSKERTYQRIEKYIDIGEGAAGAGKPALLLGAAGAIAGLAVGIVTGENIGKTVGQGATIGAAAGAIGGAAKSYADPKDEIKDDLRSKSLENKQILPNQIAYGILFFPGYANEASDIRQLKLTLSFDGDIKTINLTPSFNVHQ